MRGPHSRGTLSLLGQQMDRVSQQTRSRIMAAIRSKDTEPEMRVRRLVHAMGYRYRLHVKSLPGSPDLAFPGRHKVIFVNGCFWHQHNCRLGRKRPKSRVDYWHPKLSRNKLRDAENRRSLRKLGWRVMTIWECQTKPEKLTWLRPRIAQFLEAS